MNRTPIKSSNVVSIGYDPATGTLEVEFTSGIYQYHGVPPAIYGILMDADSKGSYLARAIKPHFAATKVTEGEKRMAEQTGPILRAKLRVSYVAPQQDQEGKQYAERVTLNAVYGPAGTDNADWSAATPSAMLDMWVSNPAAFGKLPVNTEFYVDFTPAPKG